MKGGLILIILCTLSCGVNARVVNKGKRKGFTDLDSDVQCLKWAQGGECEINPDWMKPNCPRSCSYAIRIHPVKRSNVPSVDEYIGELVNKEVRRATYERFPTKLPWNVYKQFWDGFEPQKQVFLDSYNNNVSSYKQKIP